MAHILFWSVHGFTLSHYRRSTLAAAGVPHGRWTSPRLSTRQNRDQAKACCAVQIARAVWRIVEQALISANRGCQGGHAGPPRPSAGRRGKVWEISARQFMSRSSVQGDSYHVSRSETIQQLGVILPEVMWSRFWPSQPSHAEVRAQLERLIRVTTHRFGGMPPPCTPGSIKDGLRGFP